MTEEEPNDSELELEQQRERLSDSDEESVVVLVDIKDYSLVDYSSDSKESFELTPVNSSNTSDSEDDVSDPSDVSSWGSVSGCRNIFTKTLTNSGVNHQVTQQLFKKKPLDFFNFFIDDEVIDLCVTETNKFALRTSRPWTNTTNMEMRKFFGIIMWMGIIRFPKFQDYWSRSVVYDNNIAKIMTKTRFEELLNNIHFCDIMEGKVVDKLCKVSTILDMINNKFQQAYIPGEEVCIAESNLPFCEPMYVIKLCGTGGYTWRLKVYPEKVDGVPAEEKVVLEMMDGLLDSGRTLLTNNGYTSVSLAKTLLNRNTHLVGSLRSNRANIPKEVIRKKLKKGELISRQNEDKIVVLKWKGKRDVLMLSTKHDDSMVDVTVKGKQASKPSILVDYNKGKAFLEVTNDLSANSPFLNKSIKWFKILVFHLISVTTLMNAYYLFNKIYDKNLEFIKFRELLIQEMINAYTAKPKPSMQTSLEPCVLKEVEGKKRETRKRCTTCYKQLSILSGSAYATKRTRKVSTICAKCNIPICLDCFQNFHQRLA